jgi:hypothetical protein
MAKLYTLHLSRILLHQVIKNFPLLCDCLVVCTLVTAYAATNLCRRAAFATAFLIILPIILVFLPVLGKPFWLRVIYGEQEGCGTTVIFVWHVLTKFWSSPSRRVANLAATRRILRLSFGMLETDQCEIPNMVMSVW